MSGFREIKCNFAALFNFCIQVMNNFTGRIATPITIHLIIINVLMMFAEQIFSAKGIDLQDSLGLHYYAASNFHWWQHFTYMFMHGSFSHLFNNMFSLFMFGRLLEQVWGERRFIIYYLFCGIGAGIIQQLAWRYDMGQIVSDVLSNYPNADFSYQNLITEGINTPTGHFWISQLCTIGASGSVFGILLAFGMMFPNAIIYLLIPPMPLKAKWLVIGYGIFELVAGVWGFQTGIAHYAHLGGMLFGFILIQLWKHHRNIEF